MKHDIDDARGMKKSADFKRRQLADILSRPVFSAGMRGKYPLFSGEVIETKERAVDVVQAAVEKYSQTNRKMAKWLFKPRSWKSDKPVEKVKIKGGIKKGKGQKGRGKVLKNNKR